MKIKKKKKPTKKRTIPLAYIITCFLLGIIFIRAEIKGSQHQEMLQEILKDPVKTHAVVYDKVNKRRKRVHRKYCYKFSVDGVIYKGKATEFHSTKNLHKTKIGDKIEVLYLRSDPSKHAYIEEF